MMHKRAIFVVFLSILFLTGCESEDFVESQGQVNALAVDIVQETPELTEEFSTEPERIENTIILVGEGGPSAGLFDLAAMTYQKENGGTIYTVTTGDEFISAIQSASQSGPITHLEYFGHGNEVGLWVNQDPGTHAGLYSSDPKLHEDYYSASIYEISLSTFAEDAVLTFNGCNIAEGYPDSTNFAQEVADHFKRKVEAATGPTEFIEEGEDVWMVPTYEDKGFIQIEPSFADSGPPLYEVITAAEAVAYCQDLLLSLNRDPLLCHAKGYEGHEDIRNTHALKVFVDALEINPPFSEPWETAYINWATQYELIEEDFGAKMWFTRGDATNLNADLYQLMMSFE